MSGGDKEPDELEKLLADVQRTIRENSQFIRNLKEEADSNGTAGEAEYDNEAGVEDSDFEEL